MIGVQESVNAAALPMPDLHGLRILVVEDTLLVAEVILDVLRECGCEVVGPAARVQQAVALARQNDIDGALLDMNLAGELCFPVAAALTERGIPFVFLTGYDEAAVPPEYRGVPRMTKPFQVRELALLASARFRKTGASPKPTP